jgi:lysophospholipase L1-like esterase
VLGSAPVVIAVLLCETALRLFLPQLTAWDTSVVSEPVDGLGWRSRPNIDAYVNTGERDARVITDGSRHRVGPFGAGHADVRILAVGDSMLQALQVNYEQTMTALLEKSLSARLGRVVEVVNTGVGGYDPNQYLMTVRLELAQSRYDLVLVFIYVDNDIIGRRVESYPASRNLTMPVLRPLSDSPGRTLTVLGTRISAVLAEHSHLFVFARNLVPYVQFLRHSRAAGMVHLLSPALRSNRDASEWRATSEILKDTQAAARESHVPLVFVLLPSVQYIDRARLATLERALRLDADEVDLRQPAERLGAEVQAWGGELFDAAPALRQAEEARERDLYGRVDVHLGPAGHRVMARFLEPIVLSHLSGLEAAR